MENLSPELKLQVFDQIQEVSTLSALVHASPAFHIVYAAHRSEIFLKLTLRNLKSHGIVFTKPIHWAEVCVKSGKGARRTLRRTLETVSAQIESKSPINLTIEECLALLNVVHINTWVDAEDDPMGIVCVGMPAHPFKESPIVEMMYKRAHGEQYPCGVERYALFIIEEMAPKRIEEIKTMLAWRHNQEKQAIEICVAQAAAMGFDRYGRPLR